MRARMSKIRRAIVALFKRRTVITMREDTGWYWRLKYKMYVYRTVTSMRSLGVDLKYPLGARTFKEFLELMEKKEKELKALIRK